MGVKTITLTENKGQLAGALVVREHQELVFISQNGMVQRTSVRGINRYGRASQGVRVMNIRDEDQVSAVALVVESEAATAAPVVDDDALAEGGGATGVPGLDGDAGAELDAGAGTDAGAEADADAGETGDSPADDGDGGTGEEPGAGDA
jgi:DNA gyrase subunit A